MFASSPVEHILVPRLAAQLGSHTCVLFHAPAEYLPTQLARAAMQHRYGEVGFVTFQVRCWDDLPSIGATPVLVEIGHDADLSVIETVARLSERALSAGTQVVIAWVSDSQAPSRLHPHCLIMDDQVLVLTPAEMREASGDPVLGRYGGEWLSETGGVPGLIPADGGANTQDEVVMAWARRRYPSVKTDPLVEMGIWVGRVSKTTFVRLADRLITSGVVAADPSRFTEATEICRHIPDLLARALRRLIWHREPQHAAEVTSALSEALAAETNLPGPERIQVLSTLKDWAGLDQILGSTLHQLIHFTPLQRRILAARWPSAGLRAYPRIAHGRAYLEARIPYATPRLDLPRLFSEVVFLISGETSAVPGSSGASLRACLNQIVVGGTSPNLDLARAEREDTIEWLLSEAHQMKCARDATHIDEIALLISLLLAATGAALHVGRPRSARKCVHAATELCAALGEDLTQYNLIWSNTLAWSALVAAIGGLNQLARERLDQYAKVVPDDDASHRQVAQVAASLSYLPDSQPLLPLTAGLDLEAPLAPLVAEATATQIALNKGAERAIEWARSVLNQAAWSSRPSWEWWSLRYLLVLLEARSGRPSTAQRWLDHSGLPEECYLIARAGVEFARGRASLAAELAADALDLDDVAHRWRLVALGIRLASLIRQGTSRTAVEEQLDGEDWAESLGAVVLLPDEVRQMISDRVGGQAAVLSGLQVSSADPRPEIRLTPRQIKVLEALASGGTMTQIAHQMCLSTETIRSTSKDVYRRLGVHDRTTAVELGKALGIIGFSDVNMG